MVEFLKSKERKWTNSILIIVTVAIVIYIAYIKGWISLGLTRTVVLAESKELIALQSNEKSYIGINNKQVIHITRDGIKAYNLDGDEIWQDTLSADNFVVMQKEPYIAVGSKQGKVVQIFNEKGKQAEVISNYPIVYFSINEAGGLVTIANNDTSYVVTAYDERGQILCDRTTYTKQDGYPVVAELSPDNSKLMLSYVSVDEPQVISRVYAMDVNDRDNKSRDNLEYGREQKNNLVYEIEFINENTWVAIGDKLVVWYDKAGNEIGSQSKLSLVSVPYLYQMSKHGTGYLPMILSEKPTQNLVHRQDELTYFNDKGEKVFSVNLEGGAEYVYADSNGVTVQVENRFTGYNKLGNLFFEYTASTDVSKVIYIPSIQRGIAVNKESVFLLIPEKGKSTNG
ncbi:MAG: hypothetical protein E7231_07420 [Cellulosilyticum sp.]|nr:hypothetical protein [Cellulosilyticum sp.]